MPFDTPRILTEPELNTIRGKALCGHASPSELMLAFGHFDLVLAELHKLRSCLPDKVSGTTPGAELIAGERKRQEAEEGWTSEHDDTEHRYGDLTQAAVSYAQNAICQIQRSDYPRPTPWPWEFAWWKPSADPIRNLVKAGALIAAEIDRLLRERTRTAPTVTTAQ